MELLQNTEESDSTEEQPSRVQSSEFFKSSVTEFLKKSSEMKDEFRKLEVLCQGLSPKQKLEKREPPVRFEAVRPQSTRHMEREWKTTNDALVSAGYRPVRYIGERIDSDEAAVLIRHLLKDVETKQLNLKEAYSEITRLMAELNAQSTQFERLKAQLSSLQVKEERGGHAKSTDIRRSHSKNSKRSHDCHRPHFEDTSNEDRADHASGRERSVFRAFIGRDYVNTHSRDCKVMGIIMMYEGMRADLETEIAKSSRKVRDSRLSDSTIALTSQRPKSCSEADLTIKLADMLECEATEDKVISGVLTMLKVTQVFPGIAGTLKQACEIVLHPSQPSSDLLPTLQALVRDIRQYKSSLIH